MAAHRDMYTNQPQCTHIRMVGATITDDGSVQNPDFLTDLGGLHKAVSAVRRRIVLGTAAGRGMHIDQSQVRRSCRRRPGPRQSRSGTSLTA